MSPRPLPVAALRAKRGALAAWHVCAASPASRAPCVPGPGPLTGMGTSSQCSREAAPRTSLSQRAGEGRGRRDRNPQQSLGREALGQDISCI